MDYTICILLLYPSPPPAFLSQFFTVISTPQANVLLDHDYTARLIDFGYASMMGDIPEGLTYLKRSTTKPGALRWVSPEHVSSTSDVVLSGKQPWSELGEDVAVVLKLSQGHMPARPDSIPIDDQYWELIEYCWSVIPDRRPTTTMLVSSIEQFLEDFPHSQPLRNVIASSPFQIHSQLDTSDISSFSSLVPGDKAGQLTMIILANLLMLESQQPGFPPSVWLLE
ncbi:hypothetical protein J3R82DRAFT_3633 [Butyriboletus roseoflavus]|nr:hypothetical protein J3R82DRAFT_3633 [Butyriboletus roseoflavus]